MNQPDAQPTNKVAAAGISGAASVLLVYVLGQFGLDVPPEVASAITVLAAFGAGYMTKEKGV